MSFERLFAVLPLAALAWLTFGRQRQRLFAHPGFRIDGVVLTEVVECDQDVLVGFRDGKGDGGQVFLPRLAADTSAMATLGRWRARRTVLVAATSERFVGLRDASWRHTVVAERAPSRRRLTP